jgi:D-alanyl-D-alanine dipeptidase
MNTIRSEDVPSHPDFRSLDSIAGVHLDLRYASANNFVGRDLYSPYDCAWLHRDAAAALEQAAAWLARECPGHTLLVLRPQRVQQLLWDTLRGTDLQLYLAEPERGSIHSFGMAVDVTLRDRHGNELDMGTAFDDMTERSHPALEGRMLAHGELAEVHLANRAVLRGAMQAAGFVGINTEWWHFDCGDRTIVRRDYVRVL